LSKATGGAAELRRALGLLDLTMLGASAAIGASIFSVLAPATKVSGSGILLTTLIAAVPMAIFAVVYGFMASVMPKSGASYEWPREFIHPFVGFLVAWLNVLASVGALITLAIVAVQYISRVITPPDRLTMLFLLAIIFLINVRGIRVAARAQTVAMLLLLGSLCIYVAFGVSHISLKLIGNPMPRGVLPVLRATPLLITLFLGIETCTEVGEEVTDARKTIPRALTLAMTLTVLVYMSVEFVTLGLLGPTRLGTSSAPILQGAELVMGSWAAPVILATAILALLKSLNALFIVFSRYLYAMARAGVFPAAMARIHPKWGTPYVAAAVAFGCAIAGLALPMNLVFLFVAMSIPMVLKYMTTCIAALQMIRKRPQLAAGARFPIERRGIRRYARIGVAAATAILLMGLNTDWRSYALTVGWALVGLLYWALAPSSRRLSSGEAT
jgi:basic amino acid/polyamine antiporter, APA family